MKTAGHGASPKTFNLFEIPLALSSRRVILLHRSQWASRQILREPILVNKSFMESLRIKPLAFRAWRCPRYRVVSYPACPLLRVRHRAVHHVQPRLVIGGAGVHFLGGFGECHFVHGNKIPRRRKKSNENRNYFSLSAATQEKAAVPQYREKQRAK